MNRSQFEIYLKNQGFNRCKINNILGGVNTIQDLIDLVPQHGEVLKPLVFSAFNLKVFSKQAYDKNVWTNLIKECKYYKIGDVVNKFDKIASVLKQTDNKINRSEALLNYFVNHLNHGQCETWKVKNFLEQYGETLECDETLFTSKELNKAINEIKYFL